jgi:phosphomethylpyrimidine synthase
MSAPTTSLTSDAFDNAFPGSRKAYIDGPRGIRVPMREIVLSGGEAPLWVYDPSGPQGVDVRQGLPRCASPGCRAGRTGGAAAPTELIPASLERAAIAAADPLPSSTTPDAAR